MGKQQSTDPIKSIYNDLGLQQAGVGYDKFVEKFNSDANARKSVYNDLGFEKAGIDYETFETRLGLKKKHKKTYLRMVYKHQVLVLNFPQVLAL